MKLKIKVIHLKTQQSEIKITIITVAIIVTINNANENHITSHLS